MSVIQSINDVYLDNGYKDRRDYLKCMAEDYDVDQNVVDMLADMLGEQEDFDGLVVALQDYTGNW